MSIIDKIMERRGKSNDMNKPTIGTIKLDGMGKGDTAGHFIDCANDFKSLGNSLDVRVIDQRYELRMATDKFTITSTEYTTKKDTVTLFKREGTDNQKIASGTPDEMKAKYPELKTIFVLYCIHDKKLVKVKIKGASLAGEFGFIEYSKQFSRTDPMWKYNTLITSEYKEVNRAISYHFGKFAKGKEDTSDEQMQLVDQYLDIIEGIAPKGITLEDSKIKVPNGELDDEFDGF